MSVTFKGLVFSVVRDDFDSDPQQGNVRVIEWHGSKAAIYGQFASIRNASSGSQPKCSISQVGSTPYYSLIAVYPDLQDLEPEEPDEQAVDRWTIHTETLQTDGFSLPEAVSEASAFDTGFYDKTYRKLLEDGDLSEPGLVFLRNAANGYVTAIDLFLEMRRGATHFDDEYVVLRRTRTLGNGQASKINLKAIRLIYDSGALGLPSNVGFTLPDAPDVAEWPENAYWGWRLRTQQCEFNGNRVEQSYEWVFAAWSTTYYARATGSFPF
jgi:hypothetical protein